MAHKTCLIVAAIDFGTTHSGVAFSTKYDHEKDPRKIFAKKWGTEPKAPSSVLISEDQTKVLSFGLDAETEYSNRKKTKEHEGLYFFRRLKLILKDEDEYKLEDITGRKMSAQLVLTLCIKYLKDVIFDMTKKQIGSSLTNDEVHWVISVPARWGDRDKQFMKKAAEDAGIESNHLTIALDPEAASLYCRHISNGKSKGGKKWSMDKLMEGSKYLVLDAGGRTIDITVYEVTSRGDIKGDYDSEDGWGGAKVDEEFKELLRKIIGDKAMDEFRRANLEEYNEFFQGFEKKKRKISTSTKGKITFTIPAVVSEHARDTGKDLKASIRSSTYAKNVKLHGNKLRVDASVMKAIFLSVIDSIVFQTREFLQRPSAQGCSALLMVGGFSESVLLQERFREAFPEMKLVIPKEPGTAVLKGAVMFGHKLKDSTFSKSLGKYRKSLLA